MPYWLCEQRRGQDSVPLMRFDPRFWTLNFPRPMMASVVTTGPESLRVDAVFYRSDDLAGLIWDSEDVWDHPLLAYETNRDYRRLTVRFRWQSSGVLPLDVINGPTLTIEGRDASGEPKNWYVRLWNYAQGTPEDAIITLPFSTLQGGFLLPGEGDPVFAGDIDRVFISIAPSGYSALPGDFAAGVEGWVELSEIRCDGAGVMLETGDVTLPEHGLRMAIGYDDSYNQTPARLLRQIRALGYRGSINHYVGMSHYYRLEALGGGHYVSQSGGALNTPCRAWHLEFANGAKAMGYDLIFSLSYELFDANCWNDWKQRAENGDPALTGWVPPSTLLSPAHGGAMAYLQAVARAFAYIQKLAGLPVKFQIGEPWWWITPDHRICLYDPAATASFGALSVSIPDIRGSKTLAQNIMLDRAGEMLAASTAALAAAVGDEAGTTPFTSHLLVYLPTVLDPLAPEAKRANVPPGWSAPAFDVLQLEDYDWVTSGNHGATAQAVPMMSVRLGYPVTQQHYFSGFVLHPADKAQWREIAFAADAATARGTAETFIWALPQVARDGFTHFEIGQEEDDDMRAFDDVIFPIEIGARAEVSAAFSTQVITTLSGHERRNVGWADARLSFDVAPGVRSEAELHTLIAFFRARMGPAIGFRFGDPLDYSSNALAGTPMATDQRLGAGDGLKTEFPLIKQYGAAPHVQERRITRPVAGSVIVAVNGNAVSDWSLVDRGIVRFDTAPPTGAIITSGFLFDVPVRFAEDRLDVGRATFAAGDIASVMLVEIREAA
jgi:uncharacterized protein (TIGR02217 family)